MKGLKFLFASWRKMPIFFWLSIVISAASAVLPFVFHEVMGNEDYLFPKIFLFFPSVFMSELGMICGCRDVAANKLVRSLPIAKELYTRSVPTFVLILSLGISIVMMIAYFIFLGIIGAEEFQFADVLIVGAIICCFQLSLSAFLTTLLGGGVLAVYAVIGPIIIVLIAGDGIFIRSGFGVPVWAAALIFTAAAAVGTVILYAVSARRFRTMNVKIANSALQYENK